MAVEKPSVSVVIPAYNEAERISQTLQSVLEQSYDGMYEVLVVDNNSTDQTVKIAQSFSNVRVITEKNKGVVPARNAGFFAVSGDIIASTDADTIVPRDWIERGVSHFDKANVSAVSGPDQYFQAHGWVKFVQIIYMRYVTPFLQWIRVRPHMATFNFFIRRDTFNLVGGFRDSFDEGLDLGRRVWKVGKIDFDRRLIVQTSPRRFEKLGLWAFIERGVRRIIKDVLFRSPEKMDDIR